MRATSDATAKGKANGYLAAIAGQCFPLQVCESDAGFYLGTLDGEGLPFTRESIEYWPTRPSAASALQREDWTQKPCL